MNKWIKVLDEEPPQCKDILICYQKKCNECQRMYDKKYYAVAKFDKAYRTGESNRFVYSDRVIQHVLPEDYDKKMYVTHWRDIDYLED